MNPRFKPFESRRGVVASLALVAVLSLGGGTEVSATERPRDPAAEPETSTPAEPADVASEPPPEVIDEATGQVAVQATVEAGDALPTPHAIDLAPYAGKVVYVDFWASWCTPCRASFPWMNALQRELGEDGLEIIAVNTGDTPDEATRFLEEVPVNFTLMEDPDGAIARAYGLEGMPMAYIHDRDGTLVASHAGFDERTSARRAAELRALVLQGSRER